MYKYHNGLKEFTSLQRLLDFFLGSSGSQKKMLAHLHLGPLSWSLMGAYQMITFPTLKGVTTWAFWIVRLTQNWDDFVDKTRTFSCCWRGALLYLIHFHSLLSILSHCYPLYSLLFAQKILSFFTPFFVLVQTPTTPLLWDLLQVILLFSAGFHRETKRK